jgi:membrane protease YdiL (CAAX protease family)
MHGARSSPRWWFAAGCILTALAAAGALRETRRLAAQERTVQETAPEGARIHGFASVPVEARGSLRVSVCAPGGADARASLHVRGAVVPLTRAASSVQRCTAAVWSTTAAGAVTPSLHFDAPTPRATTLTLRVGGTVGAHNLAPLIALLFGLSALVLGGARAGTVLPRAHAVTDPAAIARGLVRAVAGIVLAHLAATFVYLTAGEGPAAMLGAVLAQNVGTVLAAAWSVGALEPGTDLRDALELRPPPAGTLLRALLVGGLLVAVALLVSARIPDAGDTPVGQDIERVPLRYLIVFGGLLAPLGEELFYRGALGRLFARFGRAAVVVIPAAVFTAMHVAQLRGSPMALAPIAAVGVVNGIVRLATGGVVAPWLVHTIYNASLVSSALLAD